MKKIIDSWSQITVGQFEEMCRLQDEHPDDNAKYIVEMLYGIDDAYQIPLPEFSAMVAGLRAFSSKPINGEKLAPSATYTIDGRVYEVDITPSAFSTGQYIDLTNHIKSGASLSEVLSVVIVPDGHLYNDGYDMEAAKADINKLPVTAAFAVLNFFGKWSTASIRTFLRCLTSQMKKGKKIAPAEIEKLEKEMRELLKEVTVFFHSC